MLSTIFPSVHRRKCFRVRSLSLLERIVVFYSSDFNGWDFDACIWSFVTLLFFLLGLFVEQYRVVEGILEPRLNITVCLEGRSYGVLCPPPSYVAAPYPRVFLADLQLRSLCRQQVPRRTLKNSDSNILWRRFLRRCALQN